MKIKFILPLILFTSFSISGFSQDSLKSKSGVIHSHGPQKVSFSYHKNRDTIKSKMYFDTRLGSSTEKYDTYKKNSNGAGSVTTQPK